MPVESFQANRLFLERHAVGFEQCFLANKSGRSDWKCQLAIGFNDPVPWQGRIFG